MRPDTEGQTASAEPEQPPQAGPGIVTLAAWLRAKDRERREGKKPREVATLPAFGGAA
jgi:hypothetical protein